MVSGIFALQRHLMYHPSKFVEAPAAYGLASFSDIVIESGDGVKLHAWMHAARPGYPTLVYFHGNAGNLGDRADKLHGFAEAGFGVLALSYRGFGKSEGSPSETGIYNDARAAIAYARDEMHVPQKRIIYFGESLGSGVAVQMASERPPALLMLEAAYTSVETRSAEIYHYVLGVRHFVLDKYDSLSKIKNVHAPLLMLHGARDAVIPLLHGRTLYDAANDPKQLIVYPEVHHADFSNEQVLAPLLDVAKKYGLMGE